MLRRSLKLKTIAIVTVSLVVILAGLAVGAVRLIDRALPGYRAELAAWVSERLDQPLTIGGMELVWRWSGPSLRLTDVVLMNEQGEPTGLGLDALALRFTFVDLLHGRTMPHGVALMGPELTVVQGPDGHFRLQHLIDSGGDSFDPGALGARLQQIENIRIVNGELHLRLNALEQPITLTNIALSLTNRGSRHHLQVQLTAESRYAERLNVQATILGDLARPGATTGHVHLTIENLSATRLLDRFGRDASQMQGGRADIELWLDWSPQGFVGGRAELHLAAFRSGDTQRSATAITPPLDAEIAIEASDGKLHFSLNTLTLSGADTTATGSATLDLSSGQVQGQFARLPARLLAAAIHLWGPESIQAITTSGDIDRLGFHYDPGAGWHLQTRFSELRISNDQHSYAAGPFGGSLTLSDQGGRLELDVTEAGISSQRYLNGRLPLETLSATIDWQQTDQGRVVQLQDLHLVSAKTTITGGGSLHLPSTGSPVADLRFQIESPNIAPILDYIPQTKDMDFWHLRDWLPKAVLSGHIQSGSVRVKGPLQKFPFANGGGVFRVKIKGEGMDLAYKPGWPELRDISGSFTLSGISLEIHGTSARMLGVELGSAHAHIDNIHEPILEVVGKVARADAAAMLAFLPNSPLQEKFGRLAKVLDVSGPAGLSLKLTVPLKPELGEVKVDGQIHLAGVKLEHKVLPRPIRNIQGRVRFDRHGLYAQGLEAQLAGLPITASIEPVSDQPEGSDALVINASTRLQLPADADTLADLLPHALLARASGETTWHVSLQVSASGHISGLKLRSDLQGLALDLPEPLGKRAQTVVPLSLTLTEGRSRLHLRYGKRVRLQAELADNQLHSLDIVFGGAQVAVPPGPGVWVGGDLPVVPINEWKSLAKAFDLGDGPGLMLRGAKVHAAGLRLGNRMIGPVSIAVMPLIGADGWLATVSGKGATGNLRWLSTGGRARVNARFEHVSLSVVEASDDPDSLHQQSVKSSSETVIDPGELPELHLLVDNLRLDGDSLGQLTIAAKAIPGGLAFETLQLTGNGLTLTASGRWLRRGGASLAALKARITGQGIGQLLATLGFDETVRAQQTEIKADLQFAPHPDGLVAEALNGKLHLEMRNGMLVSVEPGAGRLLGLLNLYALPRRLLLDFGDVIGEGLAFKTLEGDFRIEDGIAYTDNLVIETSSATIEIEGRINIAERTYDEQVTIEPKVGSAATIAGTVLGGPVIGLAVFVLQDLFDQPLAEIATVTYHLSGSWSDPVIKSLQAD